MLEVLALIGLTKAIGKIVEKKGRKPTPWKVLAVVLWFGGEIIGAIIGAVISGGEGLLLYGLALVGAGAGAATAFIIAAAIPSAVGATLGSEDHVAKTFE